MSAELAARRTAAAAVLGDFRRAADEFIDDSTRKVPRPDYSLWAFRLASEVLSLLQRLETEDDRAVCACGHPRRVHNAVVAGGARGFCHECEPGGCGRCTPAAAGTGGQADAQLAGVRQVLGGFDWETGDRQYALEKIDQIVNGDPS